MKVLVSGASGAIGRQIVPRLVEAGHSVTGMTTSPDKVAVLEELGADPVIADVLDAGQVGAIVAAAAPDAILHEATALAAGLDPRHFDRDFAVTNRIRREGTDNLLAAARAAGTRTFVAQSYAGWTSARTGGRVKAEDDALDTQPPKEMRETLGAIRHLESAVTGIDWATGIVLRYGAFYGPGTSLEIDPPGAQTEAIAKRQFPLVGDGSGVWSFIHVADAAEATVAALHAGEAGIYNVVDDDPAPVRDWLPGIAARVGAKPPRRFPRWLGRLMAGEAVDAMMCDARGASNAKAKRELGWEPAHPSWRPELTGNA